jgi:hypothetical protein
MCSLAVPATIQPPRSAQLSVFAAGAILQNEFYPSSTVERL